jgi:hypothetical protein
LSEVDEESDPIEEVVYDEESKLVDEKEFESVAYVTYVAESDSEVATKALLCETFSDSVALIKSVVAVDSDIDDVNIA